MLAEISPFSVADEVVGALLDYDDFEWSSWKSLVGLCRTSEAVRELLEDAGANRQRHETAYGNGLKDQAAQSCQGILLGLCRVCDGGKNDILNCAGRRAGPLRHRLYDGVVWPTGE